MRKTPLALALLFTPALTLAAQPDNKATHLDAVTITGTRTATSVMENPASIAVVNREQIENRGADSVAELLRDIPGVAIVDSAVAGMKRIRIRGEQANRVVILVDGQEMTDHSSFGSPMLVDPANIERIEVVRGPASVMHGAKAIGGVINIITRKGADKPFEHEFGGGYHTGTHGWQGLAAFSGTLGDFDYRLSYSADDHGDRRVAKGEHSPDSRKLENSGFENQDLTLHLGMKLGEQKNHYLALKANQHKLEAEGWEDNFALVDGLPAKALVNQFAPTRADSVDENGTMKITNFNANLPKRDLEKIGLYYEGSEFGSVLKKVRANAFFQEVKREFSNNIHLQGRDIGNVAIATLNVDVNNQALSSDTLSTYGGELQFDFNFAANHYTVFGVQALKDEVKTDKSSQVALDIEVLFSTPMPPDQQQRIEPVIDPSFENASMQTLSTFIQDEWNLTEDLKFILGGRYYHVKSKLLESINTEHTAGEKSTNSRFVKAAGLTYTGLPHTSLRASYSEGFVVPTLLEQFTDSFAGRGILLNGNSSLKPELSKNYELGMRYQNRGVVFDSTLFYTDSKDYITFESCGARCEGDIYVNADKAKSFGLELLMEYWIEGTNLTPYINSTWMRREITMANFATYKTDVPTLSGQGGIRYENYFNNAEVWADLFVQAATHVDKKERPIEESGKESRHLAGWGTLNFAVGGYLGQSGQYRVALHGNNLTNKHYRTAVDEMPAMGRNAVMTFNMKF